VHLHLLSDDGKLYLQLRPDWKTIQPGKWDTAVGGHIGYGEDVEDAMHRETFEELGLRNICAKKVTEYTFRTNVDAEYVHVYIGVSSDTVVPCEETAGGRFWSFEEIEQNIGKGLFTPNFEDEYRMLSDNGDCDGFICNLTTDATS
jgi:8-oxo-dGTP pyrophosphatase MutT (NUDIX family)